MNYDDRLEASIKNYTDAENPEWFGIYDKIRINFTYPHYIPFSPESRDDAIQILEELKEEIETAITKINETDEKDYI